jgi:hypothetical protein
MTTESESFKRLMALGRVAGPDDPIYSSGLTMTSVQRPQQSMPPSQQSTAGTGSGAAVPLMAKQKQAKESLETQPDVTAANEPHRGTTIHG